MLSNIISSTTKPKNQQQTTLLEQFEKNGKIGMVVEDNSIDMMFVDGVEDYLACTGSYLVEPMLVLTFNDSPLVGTTTNLL